MVIANMLSNVNLPSAKTVVSTAASVAASAVVIRRIARDWVPYELRHYLSWGIRSIFKSFSSEITLIIEEFDGLGTNQIYKAADIYLGSKIFQSTSTFRVSMREKEKKISTSMAGNQEIVDCFNGKKFEWRHVTQAAKSKRGVGFHDDYSSSSKSDIRYYMLVFNKKHKQMVFDSYFPFVVKESQKVKEGRKTVKIHTLGNEHARRYPSADCAWCGVNLEHPATFDTLAMDEELKKTIMEDLQMFVGRKEFYRRVGKAWKRGYLLYGPPGTGKSSLIAAMANYLNFDIYDLELTAIHDNSDLRRLLISTANRSILVVEDIDCSLDWEDKKAEERLLKMVQSNQARQAQTSNFVRQQKLNQVTLSGLLNFIDGLWSSCGDERIIVFTTNHKDRLDPALLRPGRMDLHIHMSYCTPCAFRTLARNYLGLNDHSIFPDIESLLEKAMASPAEVAEQLLRSGQPEKALQGLIQFLQGKMRENEEKEAARRRKQEEEENNIKQKDENSDEKGEGQVADERGKNYQHFGTNKQANIYV